MSDTDTHELKITKLESFRHDGRDMFRVVARDGKDEGYPVDMVISNIDLHRLSLGDTLRVTIAMVPDPPTDREER